MQCSEERIEECDNSRIKIMFTHPIDVSPPSTPNEVYQFSSKERELLFDLGADLNSQVSSYSNRLHQFKQNFDLQVPPRYSRRIQERCRDIEKSPVSVNCKQYSPNRLSIFGQRKRAQTICQKVYDKYQHKKKQF